AALLPARLVPVLRKALAKDPGERYATARGMASALRLVRGTTVLPGTVGAALVREDWVDLFEKNEDDSRVERAHVLLTLVRNLGAGDVPARCGAALTLGRMGPRERE